MNKPIITLDMLKDLCACWDEREKFERHFGESVEITEELCVRYATVFDWSWAADYLLKEDAAVRWYRAAYYAADTLDMALQYARATYHSWVNSGPETVQDARAKFEGAIASATSEYCKAKASAWARIALNGGLNNG
jgi:hypothetical protein